MHLIIASLLTVWAIVCEMCASHLYFARTDRAVQVSVRLDIY